MSLLLEIFTKLYAQIPLAALALAVLLLALLGLILHSLFSHLRANISPTVQRTPEQIRAGNWREQQTANTPLTPWNWGRADREWLRNVLTGPEAQAELRAYRSLWMLGGKLLAGVCGAVVMGYYSLSMLPYLREDFVTGKALVMVLSPWLVVIYCLWLAGSALQGLRHSSRQAPVCRISPTGLTLGDRQLAWAEITGLGRIMSPSWRGEEVAKLTLELTGPSRVTLTEWGLNYRPNQLSILIEHYWLTHQLQAYREYADSLARALTFFLPLAQPPVDSWQVHLTPSAIPETLRAMVAARAPDARYTAGVELFREPMACGQLLLACSPIPGTQQGNANITNWGALASELLSRVAAPLCSTYASLEEESLSYQPLLRINHLPVLMLSLKLPLAELRLPPGFTLPSATGQLSLQLTFDGPALTTLLHTDQQRQPAPPGVSYLEQQVRDIFQAFTTHGSTLAPTQIQPSDK